ncbi:SCO family protein [Aquicoccus sp. G2-2]|uniref:SCO family protein n=1 Tax=Aquicoccus sp. G2-2 TaxID=3092120 RepID=UPI002ADF1E15|nr:SCO family protein [Aquicoccus sp. G2-2]MEA1114736.1 SCO family protein [Aquicoccus sp. G2-2]
MAKYYAWAAVAAAVLVIVGTIFVTSGKDDDKYAHCQKTAVAGGLGAIGGPFTMVDENGKTVTDKDVIDMPTLLYFGYTYCPDVCPLDSARNAEAVEILEKSNEMVKPVFVSVDPERDTPALLRDYTDNLSPRFLGLTGSSEQVKAISKAYHTYYSRREAEDGDPDSYLFDHSTSSYLVFPGEGTVAIFSRNVEPQAMADEIGCYLEAR